jgi:MFS transporter, Spinster family, sphingosine-1-phosphate transporter
LQVLSQSSLPPRPGTALTVLTGLNILNYLDRYVGAAILPLVIAELALTKAEAGGLQSAFNLTYLLVSLPIGLLGDRMHRLRLAVFGVAVWSAATFGSGLATGFATLLIARCLVGVGEASYAVVTPSVISDLYPAERRGRAMALFYAAMPVGSAVGYMLGGAIGEHSGWRNAYFVAGGPGLLLGLTLFLIPEPPRGRFDPPGARAAPLPVGASLRYLASRPSFLVNTAAQTIYTFTIGGLAYWMPTYFVQERQLGVAQASFLFGAVLLAAGFLGTIVGGRVGDALAERRRAAHFTFSGVTLAASLPFTVLAVMAPQPAIFWPSMFVTLFLLFLNTGPLNAAMANVLSPNLRASGFAVYTFVIHLLGDFPSPWVIGKAADAVGLRMPVLITGLLLVPAGLVLLFGRNTLVRDLEARAA